MTLFLPLVPETRLPSSPPFLAQSSDSQAQISKAIKSILKAKRIVVICGAGISVQAGIPDFRSSDGLFRTLKRDNPRETLASGKDLFDASVFNSEHTTALFCQMVAQLWGLSRSAQPTAFHTVLHALDRRGKLLRVYTQNIDAIEGKCGLSFGVPVFDDKRCKNRSKAITTSVASDYLVEESSSSDTGKASCSADDAPRCIPLHGTLQSMHCQICNCSFPLEKHLSSLKLGLPPQCPECTSMEETRQLVGKRARRIGKLRPSVVLYNEAHKDAEGVGEMVKKDLIGSSKGKGRSGADLLLVVGTSLRVPGTKRMVREFAKAVHCRGSRSPSSTPSPGQSPRRSPSTDAEPSMKAIYLNLDFPVPTREWEGVFDAWIQGDAQEFAELLQEEINKEARLRDLAIERKRKREEDVNAIGHEELITVMQHNVAHQFKDEEHKTSSSPIRTPKKRKVDHLITPPQTPFLGRTAKTFYIRIPPLAQRKLRPPDPCISTPPSTTPHSKKSSKSFFAKGQPPITPETSPSPPLAAKSRRKPTRKAKPISHVSKSSSASASKHNFAIDNLVTFDSALNAAPSDKEVEASNLSSKALRQLQLGLRESDG